MSSAYQLPTLSASTAPAIDIPADLIALPVHEQASGARFDAFDAATGGELRAAIARGAFAGKPGESLLLPLVTAPGGARRLLALGLGPVAAFSTEGGRRAAATAVLTARRERLGRLVWAVDGALAEPLLLETAAEAFAAANFDPAHYKTQDVERFFVDAVVATTDAGDAAGVALRNGLVIGEAINGARHLVNEPGNLLPPRALAERARALADVPRVTAEILDEDAIRDLGMGLLLGVARGSAEPPRLLALRYEPPQAPADGPVLALVGKGITFDTGGLSLKPADGMERMKDDMAGAATVVAALRAIALLQVPVRVIAVVPTCENMPGGRATRPGDVLTGASGITVEVNNTDAEGRLILGDGLWYARRLGATHIVDVATLTGACIVALGKITTGLFAAPDGWSGALTAAAARAGEKLWPMPVFDEYKEQLKSEIADMLNSPGRPAGAITAAHFLKAFTGDLPWAHLDIAGTAWSDDQKPWAVKGATGAMIRTLVELARLGPAGWEAR
ncbi:MAG: leucyl aminopeptidase [Vicinamibacterales bacterium]